MTALTTARIFHTFHSITTFIPAEITTQILNYIVADARWLSFGGGVTTHSTHHPIASVSPTLRSIYLNLPYSPSINSGATAPVKLRIGEVLDFSDLRTLAAFFENGPGRDATTLYDVRFLSVSYLDDHTATGWGGRTINYAYEAFEHLYKNWDSMRISWLQLRLPSRAISSVDDPGLWNLLKIRNLRHLTILGPHGCIASDVRRCLKARTHKKNLFPWRPLGLENVGGDWRDCQGQGRWQEQYKSLDSRYKYLHHRETVTERREKQQEAYYKRQKRWPMLSKRRKRRHV